MINPIIGGGGAELLADADLLPVIPGTALPAWDGRVPLTAEQFRLMLLIELAQLMESFGPMQSAFAEVEGSGKRRFFDDFVRKEVQSQSKSASQAPVSEKQTQLTKNVERVQPATKVVEKQALAPQKAAIVIEGAIRKILYTAAPLAGRVTQQPAAHVETAKPAATVNTLTNAVVLDSSGAAPVQAETPQTGHKPAQAQASQPALKNTKAETSAPLQRVVGSQPRGVSVSATTAVAKPVLSAFVAAGLVHPEQAPEQRPHHDSSLPAPRAPAGTLAPGVPSGKSVPVAAHVQPLQHGDKAEQRPPSVSRETLQAAHSGQAAIAPAPKKETMHKGAETGRADGNIQGAPDTPKKSTPGHSAGEQGSGGQEQRGDRPQPVTPEPRQNQSDPRAMGSADPLASIKDGFHTPLQELKDSTSNPEGLAPTTAEVNDSSPSLGAQQMAGLSAAQQQQQASQPPPGATGGQVHYSWWFWGLSGAFLVIASIGFSWVLMH